MSSTQTTGQATGMTRREFVASSAAFVGFAAAGLMIPRRAWGVMPRFADPTFYKWQEIAPGFQVALGKTDDFSSHWWGGTRRCW